MPLRAKIAFEDLADSRLEWRSHSEYRGVSRLLGQVTGIVHIKILSALPLPEDGSQQSCSYGRFCSGRVSLWEVTALSLLACVGCPSGQVALHPEEICVCWTRWSLGWQAWVPVRCVAVTFHCFPAHLWLSACRRSFNARSSSPVRMTLIRHMARRATADCEKGTGGGEGCKTSERGVSGGKAHETCDTEKAESSK